MDYHDFLWKLHAMANRWYNATGTQNYPEARAAQQQRECCAEELADLISEFTGEDVSPRIGLGED